MSLVRVVVAFIATYGAGLVGFFFIDASASSWYATLAKPTLTPSAAVFPVVWTILYALMAIALSIVWQKSPQTYTTEGWVRFYFVQLLFNAAWTIFFFGLHAILVAFFDILFLGFTVIALMVAAVGIDRRVLYLLTPYLVWVLFAAYLNLSIWLMN